MNIRYIYWFALFDLTSPSVRYRGKYLLDELGSKYGIRYSIAYPGYDLRRMVIFIRMFLSALLFRKKNSLIVIQRVYTRGIYATALKILIRLRGRNSVYDIDDAEYVPNSPETIHFFMKHCTACCVGSQNLLVYARNFNPNSFLLTTPVTFHNKKKIGINQVLTIGWIGCFWGGHRDSLYSLFFPALLTIPFPVKIVILGARSTKDKQELINYLSSNKNVIPDIPEEMDWLDEDAIYERVREFDFGISPLLDTEINRSKSGYKLKQYFSCGVPALGSDIGENSVFLKHGVNGYFCNTPEEYREMILKIKSLPEDEYRALSENAYLSRKEFDIRYYSDAFLCQVSHLLS